MNHVGFKESRDFEDAEYLKQFEREHGLCSQISRMMALS
jgi:hypothetical protein